MQFRNSPEHYGLLALSFHWLTVALVMVAWTLGTFDDVLPRGAARATGLFVHVTAGVAILTLLLCWAVWRLNDPPPPVEPSVLGRGEIVQATSSITRSTCFLRPSRLRALW